MGVDFHACASVADRDVLHALACDPSLAGEFELMQSRAAVESGLHDDPRAPRNLQWIVRVDGVPAAFGFVYVLPSFEGDWAMVRIGVLGPMRRRGIATRLLDAAIEGIRREAPDCHEVCVSAWTPAPEVAAFAAHHGFAYARTFWLMEREARDFESPSWPDGVEVRTFDGTTRALSDFNDAYNDSFRHHYHGVISSLEDARAVTRRPDFRPEGTLLAYRGDRCVGFCRDELHPHRGEVGVLGVVSDARGIGLGRALLRWGVAWLHRAGAPRITLVVDGENETALRLYRSERFEIARTRDFWTRRLDRVDT